jgi:thimet oligopeptidase
MQTAVDARLTRAQQLLNDLLAVKGPRTIDNTLEPYDELLDEIRTASGTAGIMAAVHPDEAMRKAGDDLERKADAPEAEIALRPDGFSAVQAVRLAHADRATRY